MTNVSEIQCQKRGITPWAWCLIAGCMALAALLLRDEYAEWAITVGWFACGLLCIWNVKSCGRYHCAITGPGFLGMGILSMLEALDIVNLQEWIGWSILAAVLAIGFGLEFRYKLRHGTYYRK